ncbi:hypothetical protein HanRHA438_Chr17g0839211 [Helianthus annuus]|nr:hypothetical protein HanIR_Chr17g0899891 [Helianthus annuus]KAJ0828617.1 hypothetical protein HanRHA438_Chr17g0839211 [Helianthus annuus]
MSCDINSSDTRILRVPDGVFWISNGEHELAAAFFKKAAFIFILSAAVVSCCCCTAVKEAIVTNERTE